MDQGLDEIILHCCESSPTEPCLWWRGAWWSRGALNEMASECERHLVESGFSARQRLGLVLPNSPLFLASCIAAWRLGGTVVPVNPMLKYPSVPEYLKSVGVFGAVVSREMEGMADFINGHGIPAASADLGDAVPEMRGRSGTPDPDSGTAALFHTAGAGGDVKAVPITHRNITSLLSSVLETIPLMDEDDVVLNAIPNYHSLGFVVGGIMPLASGISQVLVPSFASPKTTMSAIRGAGVTIIPALPIMLGMLLGGERDITPVSKVKMVFYGGGELMPGIARRVKEIFGVEPLEGYGLTEASSVLAVTPSEDAIRPGTSGRILPCFEAKVCDREGNSLPFDSDGRLWIRGDALASGYYGRGAPSAERFRDGWFDTQDIVRVDSDGFITIVSPVVDVIMAGGVPVYPGEIEAILKGHPEIEDAAVIGIPRGTKGELARAFVVLKEGSALRPRDIVLYGRSKLPNYKAPRSVRILNELPKDNLGKVLKKELRGA
ncbi:MAG: AMP-binding protein [Synergistaceae bacterium]|jgi:long-chain acyl-CoA synthetase|nr:AMP-binding protein [Synergistaceae bacterium]